MTPSNHRFGALPVAGHLVRRFVGSLSRREPVPNDQAWALGYLNEGQTEVWHQMSPQDRRHAIDVARAVDSRLSEVEAEAMDCGWFADRAQLERSALAAALMHDSGKVVAGIGTFTRVGATVLWALAPEDLCQRWLHRAGVRQRLAQYHQHPRLGGELLAQAGSSRLVYTWAQEHHRRPQNWTVPGGIGQLLKDCDDD